MRSGSWWFLGSFALLKLALQLVFIQGYGWFRDEFYYLACSRNLDFGFVDHPPLSILVLTLSRTVLGDSLIATRIPPALAGAVTVVGGAREGHERRFKSVERVTETDCGYCMPYENGNGVFVLRGPRRPVAETWPELKHYD